MTNTAKSIKCGNCSTFQAPVYHGSVDAVRACFQAKFAPVIPVAAAPKVEVPISVKTYGRFSASCPAKGCQVFSVQGKYFDLVCTEHKTVTGSKQLVGKVSSKGHLCDARCTGAKGSHCECSCMGANHGADYLINA